MLRAGRTVVFAGTALAVGMLGAFFIAPGSLLESATARRRRGLRARGRDRAVRDPGRPRAARHATSTAGSCGRPAGRTRGCGCRSACRASRWSRCCSRRSRCCSCPRRRWRSTPGRRTSQNLPPDDASRKSFEAFQRDRGAGWATPFEVDFQTAGPDHDRGAAAAPEAVPAAGRAPARHRGGAGPRVAARAHRGAAQPHPPDRVGRPAAEPPRGGPGAPAVRVRAPQPRAERRGRPAPTQLNNGLGQAAAGSDEIARGTSDAVPQTQRLSDGVAQTKAGSHRLNSAARRASCGRA